MIDLRQVTLHSSLSSGQRKIVERALAGESFFFTGAAGTGKSFVLKEIIRVLKMHYDDDEVQVVAPTGMAALELGGWTIHSFAGIGLGLEPMDKLKEKVMKNAKSRNRWRQTCVLIVDEVSMLSADLFDKLEYLAQQVRRRGGVGQGFGGMQLILCGDFFQLPPVMKVDRNVISLDDSKNKRYAFQSKNWPNCVTKTYTLKDIFRQVGDNQFIEILNEIRMGKPSDKTMAELQRRVKGRGMRLNLGMEPTKLFPTKNQVQDWNLEMLKRLEGLVVTYKATCSTLYNDPNSFHEKALKESCPAPEQLHLKQGALVVLLRNKKDWDLVNGSRGIVRGFAPPTKPGEQGDPIVEFENRGDLIPVSKERWTIERGDEVVASLEQIPLTLSWALSIHKSQGMTISQIEVSLKDIFEDGQAYVALSRVTSLAGLVITEDFPKTAIRTNPDVVSFYQSLSLVE